MKISGPFRNFSIGRTLAFAFSAFVCSATCHASGSLIHRLSPPVTCPNPQSIANAASTPKAIAQIIAQFAVEHPAPKDADAAQIRRTNHFLKETLEDLESHYKTSFNPILNELKEIRIRGELAIKARAQNLRNPPRNDLMFLTKHNQVTDLFLELLFRVNALYALTQELPRTLEMKYLIQDIALTYFSLDMKFAKLMYDKDEFEIWLPHAPLREQELISVVEDVKNWLKMVQTRSWRKASIRDLNNVTPLLARKDLTPAVLQKLVQEVIPLLQDEDQVTAYKKLVANPDLSKECLNYLWDSHPQTAPSIFDRRLLFQSPHFDKKILNSELSQLLDQARLGQLPTYDQILPFIQSPLLEPEQLTYLLERAKELSPESYPDLLKNLAQSRALNDLQVRAFLSSAHLFSEEDSNQFIESLKTNPNLNPETVERFFNESIREINSGNDTRIQEGSHRLKKILKYHPLSTDDLSKVFAIHRIYPQYLGLDSLATQTQLNPEQKQELIQFLTTYNIPDFHIAPKPVRLVFEFFDLAINNKSLMQTWSYEDIEKIKNPGWMSQALYKKLLTEEFPLTVEKKAKIQAIMQKTPSTRDANYNYRSKLVLSFMHEKL